MPTSIQRLRRSIAIAIASLILLALLIAIATIVWQKNVILNNAQRSPLGVLTEITSILIQRPNVDDIKIMRRGENWMIEQPCAIPVNKQRLSPLLNALEPSAHGAYNAEEVDLQAAGLLDPEAVILLNGDRRIKIGNTDLSGNRRYIQYNNKVELKAEWILALINGGLSALSELAIFPQKITAIARVDENGAADQNVNQLDKWQRLNAQQIVTWPLEESKKNLQLSAFQTSQADKQQSFKLYRYAQFSAIVFDNAQCAYILSNDDVPELEAL